MPEKLAVEVALEGSEQVQRDLSNLEQSFVNAGIAVRNFAESFATIAAAAGVAAIAAAGAALIKFSGIVEDTSKALTQLQKVSGASFENLSAMQQVFAAGGTELKKFASEFGNLSEKIAAAGQAREIRETDKEWVKWQNDIDMVRGKFDNLATGAREIFSPLTTLQTKVDALLESLAKAGDSQQQWFKLADIFKNLSTDMERAQLGKALGLSPETIATLSRGSAALKELEAEAQRLGLVLTTSNQQALEQMSAGWFQFTALLSAALQKIAATFAPVFDQLIAISNQALADIVQDFQTLPLDQAMEKLGERLGPAFEKALELLQPIFSKIGEVLVQTATTIGAAMGKALILAMLPQILQGKGPIVEAVKSLFAGTAGLGGAGGVQPGGAAAGGLIGGSGTGTSDSNLAWVSRGEYVVPARAVAQPGILQFLEALRRSGGNLSRVLDGMGRFALGGLVARPLPAFADGGLAGGMSNVTIQFPGLPDIGGLRASSSTVDELRRAAALAQVRSGGRKPSRYS